MKKTQIIGGILTAVGLGVVVYFGFIKKYDDELTGWQKIMKKKPKGSTKTPPSDTIITPDGTPAIVKKGFPINFNTPNENVPALQDALINKLLTPIKGAPTKNIGNKTLAALKTNGYDVPVTESDFNDIIAGKKKGIIEPAKTKYGEFAPRKTAYATTTEKIKSIGINTNLDVNLQKTYPVGTINKVLGDYVWIDTLVGRVGISKNKLEIIS